MTINFKNQVHKVNYVLHARHDMPTPVDVNFSTLFSMSHLHIPEFQRGYSWQEPQLEELWVDIQQIPDEKHHYCGAILTVRLGHIRTTLPAPAQVEKLVLVDGQQRCTSIFLLLLSIRDRFNTIGLDTQASEIDSGFIHFTEYGGQEHLRLKNEHLDLNNFMKQVVDDNQPNPTVAPEKRLVEAKKFFDDKISYFEEADLENLRYRITTQLITTQVYLDETLDKPTVFEAINNRGLILSSMDKLKNYSLLLISRIDELNELDINFEQKWFKALEYLMKHNMYSRKKEDILLSYYWQMREGVVPINSFDSFQKKFGPLIRNPDIGQEERDELIQSFIEYCNGFVKFSELFTEIESRSHTYNKWSYSAEDNNLRSKAKMLHKKQDSIGHPDLLLSIVVASYFKFNSQEYVKILEYLEKMLFRVYRIINKPSNHAYTKIPKMASDIYLGSKNANDVIQWCIDFSQEEGVIQEIVADNLKRPNSYSWRGINYFLHEFERSLGGGVIIEFSEFPKKEISIEHVLPQNPHEGSNWNEIFSYEEQSKLKHNLGNLCLTQDNSYYLNHDYSRKKNGVDEQDQRCYKRASTHQEKQIASEYEDWTPESVLERERKLINFAIDRWKFDCED